jgi:hypothetical protein
MSLFTNPSGRVLRRIIGVNLNAVNSVPVIVPFAKTRVLACSTTNASTSLATTAATLGLYTATAGGGTAIVTAATASLTPLTTALKIKDCTLASTDVLAPNGQIYIFVGVVHGAAATCDVLIEFQQIP